MLIETKFSKCPKICVASKPCRRGVCQCSFRTLPEWRVVIYCNIFLYMSWIAKKSTFGTVVQENRFRTTGKQSKTSQFVFWRLWRFRLFTFFFIRFSFCFGGWTAESDQWLPLCFFFSKLFNINVKDQIRFLVLVKNCLQIYFLSCRDLSLAFFVCFSVNCYKVCVK